MTPLLKTKTLRLYSPMYMRPDVASHVEWLNDKSVVEFSEQRHRKHTIDSQLAYIKSFDQVYDHFWEIAFINGEYNQAIGTITAHIDQHNKVADVGILIGKPHWGKGVGTQAWIAVCDWLLSTNVRKVEAGAMEANTGMIAIFYKTNMKIEGFRLDHFILHGKPQNMVLAGRFK